MAEPQQLLVDIDPDFEPLSRPRSCTWPLHRPEFSEPGSSNTSSPAPSVKPEQGIVDFINSLSLLEETEDYQEEKPVLLNDFQCQDNCVHPQQQHPQQPNPQLPHTQQVPAAARPCQQLQPCSGPEEEQLVSQERVGGICHTLTSSPRRSRAPPRSGSPCLRSTSGWWRACLTSKIRATATAQPAGR